MRISGFFRRFICCLLIALLLVSAAIADTVDLSSMTDAEIVALLDQVNQEITDRGINKTANLPQGAYIGGRDLPVGRYILTILAKGDDWGNLTVKSEEGSGKLILWEVVSAPGNGELKLLNYRSNSMVYFSLYKKITNSIVHQLFCLSCTNIDKLKM